MNKIQKFINREFEFFLIILILIITLFTIFSPKVSSILFSLKRQTVLSGFINQTKVSGAINPQDYWKFREFYSPGYFTFSKKGISKPLLDNAKKELKVEYSEKMVDLTFLFFSSPNLKSLDMLTRQTNLDILIDKKLIAKDSIIFMNKNSLIYKEDSNTINIIFLLNNTDVQKANGFFDYGDKDKKLTHGENWFNLTTIKIH